MTILSDTASSVTKDVPYTSNKYNPQEIEPKWQQRWAEDDLYTTDLHDDSNPKLYFLTMYPYPSGNLHVGHWYAETPADAAARYLRMQGNTVFFPMGFDAFGLPAENAAIKAARAGEDVHPATLTYERMATMKQQFRQMGAMFDWSKTLATCDPEYYKWNQWFFIEMVKKGVAYRKESVVNWDPVDQTVLANEQVIDGRGERSGALVERRLMPQWHFKITDYADELLNFDGLDWPERVRLMQTNWIGRSEGAEVIFKSDQGDDIEIFTTRPDTLWGATFMVLAPEHPLVAKLTADDKRDAVNAYVEQASRMSEIDRQAEGKDKTGEFIGSYAVNPVNGAKIPIWIADYVMMGYGTGAIMAVPYGDQRDFEFAKKFDLDIIPVVKPEDESISFDPEVMTEAYAGPGTMINSGPLDGVTCNEQKGRKNPAIDAAIRWLEDNNAGQERVNYRLRDWLISRQRYWGTPIPMIYCDDCGIVPEKEENLPVVLPEDIAFLPTGESPLKSHEAFINCTCPSCGGAAKRETDTMDTFMDSSWYWFRYLSPNKEDGPFDSALAQQWTPVNLYTGGIEHAILHLLYARFFTKVIRDLGLTTTSEPFTKLRNQGMILGEDNEKMSKSRGNVVNPDDLVAEYGADTVRTYLMFIGPWSEGGPWNSQGIEGVSRFLRRAWSLIVEPAQDGQADPDADKTLTRAMNLAIKEVTEDLDAFQFNTAIAELMTLVNVMSKAKNTKVVITSVWQDACKMLVTLLAPFAPHISEELWSRLGHETSVHLETWPGYDEAALEQSTVPMAVQVNGKVRAQIEVPKDASKEAILEVAKAEPNIAKYLQDGDIKREIVVPGKLVNLVVK
ncbi:MAG: leucine--tRNA ligase [Deinococcota bacterium]